MVDALAPELTDGDGDVLGRTVLAGVDRPAQPVAGRFGERGGEGRVVDVAFDGVGAHPDQQVAVGHGAGERRHLHRVRRPGGLVEVEDHAAVDVEVLPRVEDTGLHALPHGLHRHAETDDEPGREEHLAVTHPGGRTVLERFVRDAAEVVGGAQAGADDVVDREELVEAGELEELSGILDRERDGVLPRQVGDGRRAGGALDVAVQLDLGKTAEMVVGGVCHSSSLVGLVPYRNPRSASQRR